MRIACLFSAALVAATPALSQCLTAADLPRGVAVGFQSGDVTIHRQMSDGFLQIDETYANGDPTMRFRAWKGIYFTEEFQLTAGGQAEPGTRLVIEFPVDPSTLPVPMPGMSWTGQTTNIFDDGFRRPETTSLTFSAAQPITLSGCSYDAVQADLRYDWGADGGLTLRYLYLPAMQTAILMSNQFDGSEMATTVPVTMTRTGK